MTIELVLRVTASDKPGIVKKLSQVIADHSGSWIDSSMARLGGEFAGIVRIVVPEGEMATVERDFSALAEHGISVTVRAGATAATPIGQRAQLDLTGLDHPGIIHEISSALARHGVSFEELHTQVFAGSMTGVQYFAAKSVIILPEGLSADRLRDDLEQIATDVMVEVTLQDVEAG